MTTNQEIRKLFYKHFPTPQTVYESPETAIKSFIEELGELVQRLVSGATKDVYRDSTLISVQDLEEILRVIREFKGLRESNFENRANMKPDHTIENVFRLNELKYLEYKLTEKILTANK